MRVKAVRPLALALCCLALVSVSARLGAQGAVAPNSTAVIYTCTDDHGRKLNADRPIAACTTKEQRVLNKDGSLKAIHPPVLTAEEAAAKDARERKQAEARAAHADAVRRDRNLLARFPNEPVHRKAREAALDTVREAIKTTEARLGGLTLERQPLLAEAEFYKGKALPPKLRGQLDANDAAAGAQREAALNQQAELDRVNHLYDTELGRLKQLWSGAAPGSLGAIAAQRAATPVAASASNLKALNLR